jgi:hypothetical protein
VVTISVYSQDFRPARHLLRLTGDHSKLDRTPARGADRPPRRHGAGTRRPSPWWWATTIRCIGRAWSGR